MSLVQVEEIRGAEDPLRQAQSHPGQDQPGEVHSERTTGSLTRGISVLRSAPGVPATST